MPSAAPPCARLRSTVMLSSQGTAGSLKGAVPLVAPELEVPNAAAVAEAVQLPKGYAELPGPLEHAIRPAAPCASSAAAKVALLATGAPALLTTDRRPYSTAACAASCFEGSHACPPGGGGGWRAPGTSWSQCWQGWGRPARVVFPAQQTQQRAP